MMNLEKLVYELIKKINVVKSWLLIVKTAISGQLFGPKSYQKILLWFPDKKNPGRCSKSNIEVLC